METSISDAVSNKAFDIKAWTPHYDNSPVDSGVARAGYDNILMVIRNIIEHTIHSNVIEYVSNYFDDTDDFCIYENTAD